MMIWWAGWIGSLLTVSIILWRNPLSTTGQWRLGQFAYIIGFFSGLFCIVSIIDLSYRFDDSFLYFGAIAVTCMGVGFMLIRQSAISDRLAFMATRRLDDKLNMTTANSLFVITIQKDREVVLFGWVDEIGNRHISFGDKTVRVSDIRSVSCVNSETTINFVTTVQRFIALSDGKNTIFVDCAKSWTQLRSDWVYRLVYDALQKWVFPPVAVQMANALVNGYAIRIGKLVFYRDGVEFPRRVLHSVQEQRRISWKQVSYKAENAILSVHSEAGYHTAVDLNYVKNAHLIPYLVNYMKRI